MGKCKGLVWCLVKNLCRLGIFFLAVVYFPRIPPHGIFTSTKIAPPRSLEGPLALNTALNNAEHLYVDKVRGPECLVDVDGELYASVHGGEVVKLSPGGHVTHVASIGQPCEGYWQESKCGRPLGMAFDKAGALLVMDSYYGIWKVDVKTGKKTQLVSPDTEIEGRKPMLFNSIALAANGDFYWTDSSSSTTLENGVFAMLIDGNGRLFHYDAAKKTNRVLLDGLWFANGVVLSPNEDFVVVSETARSQLRRYYLKGPNKGSDDIFVDGLTGLPDNLKVIPGGLLVPLVVPRDDRHPVVFQILAPHPLIRKFVARIMAMPEALIKAVNSLMPHYLFEKAIHLIGHFESVQGLIPKRTSLIKLNWNGDIVGSWHNVDGSLSGISEVLVMKNQLYFGSPYNTYVGRVPLPEGLVEGIKSESKPKLAEVPKPKPAEAPKPKPAEAPKPKPAEVPKPKPAEVPKPKPAEAPKPKPAEAPKPKPTEAPKSAEAPKPKEVPKKNEVPKPKKEEAKPIATPVVEDIPSDTRPPKKEHMKVIKKEGPMEIPLPKENQGQKPKPEAKTAHSKTEL